MKRITFWDFVLFPIYVLVVIGADAIKGILIILRFSFKLGVKLRALCLQRMLLTIECMEMFVRLDQHHNQADGKPARYNE